MSAAEPRRSAPVRLRGLAEGLPRRHDEEDVPPARVIANASQGAKRRRTASPVATDWTISRRRATATQGALEASANRRDVIQSAPMSATADLPDDPEALKAVILAARAETASLKAINADAEATMDRKLRARSVSDVGPFGAQKQPDPAGRSRAYINRKCFNSGVIHKVFDLGRVD